MEQAVEQQAADLAVQGKGLVAAGTTAVASSVGWLHQASEIVDLVSGIVAVVAGLFTIAWYSYRFYRHVRGEHNEGNSS